MDSESELSDVEYEPAALGQPEYKLRSALKPPRTTTYTAQALYDQIVEGVVDLEPEYQRDVVWSEEKQIMLVDSIFRNFYVPPIIFAVTRSEDGTERRVCIDGKQRLTSIQKFMDGLIYHRDIVTSAKYWYKKLGGRRQGSSLSEKYKRLFANKQIVCIEYEELSEQNEREIFRRVQLGVALKPAEKLRAEDKTPRQALAQELDDKYMREFVDYGFDIKRAASFRGAAQCICTIARYPQSKAVTNAPQLTKWLVDPAVPEPDFVAKVHQSFQIAVEMVKEDRSFLAVTQGPTTISLLDMVMMMLVIYLFRERMPKEALARCVQGMRQVVRREHTDIRWNAGVLATGMGFLAQLQGGSEQKAQPASNGPANTVTAPSSGARHDPPPLPPPPPTDTPAAPARPPAATSRASDVHRRLAAMRAAKESLNALPPPPSSTVALPLPPTSASARGMAAPADPAPASSAATAVAGPSAGAGGARASGSGSGSGSAGRQDGRYHPYRGSSASSASGARASGSPAGQQQGQQQDGDVRMKDEFGA